MERTPLSSSHADSRLASGLAAALVSGPWRPDDLAERGRLAIGRRARWLPPLAARLVASFGDGPRPTGERVASFLKRDAGFLRACARSEVRLAVGRKLPPVMWPAPGAPSSWAVPPIVTPAALGEWLGLEPGELDWFADRQGRLRRAAPNPLRHYRYAWRAKATGSRLIEAPKPRLKAVQRRVLDTILAPIPPHESAHGFRSGRSVLTYAAPHAGRQVVLKLDLKDFFPTVTAARVAAVFLTAGYPGAVARLLAGLCTNRVPRPVWNAPGAPGQGPDAWRVRRLLEAPHLPQGAPTSPALANLSAYRLDARLHALATSAGATYSRYADDLAFSGGPEFARSAGRFALHACATADEEGFRVNTRKTRVMRRGVRQQVAGVVVNDRPNVARDEYDRLKAVLHNCRKLGPAGQNRDAHRDFRAHLSGRVAHVGSLNSARGERLRAVLETIAW